MVQKQCLFVFNLLHSNHGLHKACISRAYFKIYSIESIGWKVYFQGYLFYGLKLFHRSNYGHAQSQQKGILTHFKYCRSLFLKVYIECRIFPIGLHTELQQD